MPIMSAQGRNDARATARLLASIALESIKNPHAAPQQEVSLNNVFRLLESYRTNVLFSFEPPIVPLRNIGIESLSLLPADETHVREVSDAIAEAIKHSFGETSREDAIRVIIEVIKAVVYPAGRQVTEDERTKSSLFFEKVASALHAA